MTSELKLLFGIAKKLLYMEKTVTAMKQASTTGQSSSAGIAKVLAVVFQQAIAKAQQAGANLDNKTVMMASAMIVKEAIDILKKQSNIPKDQQGAVGKALIAMMLKEIKNLISLQKGRSAGQAPAAPSQPGGQGIVASAMQGGV